MRRHALDARNEVFSGRLPKPVLAALPAFDELWDLHPPHFHEIRIHGRTLPTPRWQQAYGADYHYSGRHNVALPIPPSLTPLLTWTRHDVDERFNGLLLNWYDGRQGHYIGRHRDSTVDLLPGAPIAVISLGDERVFRLRPHRGKGFRDIPLTQGSIIVLPFAANQSWTHEVPHFVRNRGRRISVSVRAFRNGADVEDPLPS